MVYLTLFIKMVVWFPKMETELVRKSYWPHGFHLLGCLGRLFPSPCSNCRPNG
ncbi:hypothetical protein AHAS_Ahas17G0219200 [Arachis hypogaea]